MCELRTDVDMSGVDVIELTPIKQQVEQWRGDYMLLSGLDRNRDFESPPHASECHSDSSIPGYVDYGISHGARLIVNIEQGRLVFFIYR